MKFDVQLAAKAGLLLCATLALGACATNKKVATSELNDSSLTCEQIATQDKGLNDILEKAQHNKGVSGANVAAVLLFWPAAIGNYMDADKAEALVVKRKAVLVDLHKAKGCK